VSERTYIEEITIRNLGIIDQSTLELGSGFAFVARQKHLRIEEQNRYIDLLFYHCRMKFYLLIDLKVGELTHADVGQMDGYVRMFDDLKKQSSDNPTIGILLCTETDHTIAKYSILNDKEQQHLIKEAILDYFEQNDIY
jgi:hypothetical protein